MRAPDAEARRQGWLLAVLLGSVATLGPFAIDMYLPAFPAIGYEFGASPSALQQTPSLYMFAYAFVMLWHFPFSEVMGRKRVVLGGLAMFAILALGPRRTLVRRAPRRHSPRP